MLDNFCGLRLNTAAMVIGWLGAAWSLLMIVLFSIGLGYLDELSKVIADNTNDPNLDQATIRNLLLVVMCVYITIHAINIAASSLLIAGTVKERHLLLVPWLINSGVSLLLSGMYIIAKSVEISAAVSVASLVFWLIISVLNLVVQFYIWYAIYSLFKKIQANREVQQRLIPPTSSSYPSYTKI